MADPKWLNHFDILGPPFKKSSGLPEAQVAKSPKGLSFTDKSSSPRVLICILQCWEATSIEKKIIIAKNRVQINIMTFACLQSYTDIRTTAR